MRRGIFAFRLILQADHLAQLVTIHQSQTGGDIKRQAEPLAGVGLSSDHTRTTASAGV